MIQLDNGCACFRSSRLEARIDRWTKQLGMENPDVDPANQNDAPHAQLNPQQQSAAWTVPGMVGTPLPVNVSVYLCGWTRVKI